jgi:hypothetical protein
MRGAVVEYLRAGEIRKVVRKPPPKRRNLAIRRKGIIRGRQKPKRAGPVLSPLANRALSKIDLD